MPILTPNHSISRKNRGRGRNVVSDPPFFDFTSFLYIAVPNLGGLNIKQCWFQHQYREHWSALGTVYTDAVNNIDPDPEPWYQLSSSCQIRRHRSNYRHKNRGRWRSPSPSPSRTVVSAAIISVTIYTITVVPCVGIPRRRFRYRYRKNRSASGTV